MTICISILDTITESEIKELLASDTSNKVNVLFDTHDDMSFNRSFQSDDSIVAEICDYVNEQQSIMSSMQSTDEPTEEDLDAMYEDMILKHIAEYESIGEREEAILHHYM